MLMRSWGFVERVFCLLPEMVECQAANRAIRVTPTDLSYPPFRADAPSKSSYASHFFRIIPYGVKASLL